MKIIRNNNLIEISVYWLNGKKSHQVVEISLDAFSKFIPFFAKVFNLPLNVAKDIDNLPEELTEETSKKVLGYSSRDLMSKDLINLYFFWLHLLTGEWYSDNIFKISFYKKGSHLCIQPNKYAVDEIVNSKILEVENQIEETSHYCKIYETDFNREFKFAELQEESVQDEFLSDFTLTTNVFKTQQNTQGTFILVSFLNPKIQSYLYEKYQELKKELDQLTYLSFDSKTLYYYENFCKYVQFMVTLLNPTESRS